MTMQIEFQPSSRPLKHLPSSPANVGTVNLYQVLVEATQVQYRSDSHAGTRSSCRDYTSPNPTHKSFKHRAYEQTQFYARFSSFHFILACRLVFNLRCALQVTAFNGPVCTAWETRADPCRSGSAGITEPMPQMIECTFFLVWL
ncbi:hypothetical protein C8J57DRAFT_1223311 [Mycena rebaudengoi]|nr:hypothetical protein C8J57DRAFT_1223311 [Mycena rebaudengoi]